MLSPCIADYNPPFIVDAIGVYPVHRGSTLGPQTHNNSSRQAGLESKALPVLMQLAMDAKNADRIHRSLLAANVATLYAAHPGASAYGLFNEWIVRDVLSVLRTAVGLVAADFAASGGTKGASKSSKGRKRSSKRSSGAATASSKRARRSAAPSSFGDDGAGDDSDDNDRDGNGRGCVGHGCGRERGQGEFHDRNLLGGFLAALSFLTTWCPPHPLFCHGSLYD